MEIWMKLLIGGFSAAAVYTPAVMLCFIVFRCIMKFNIFNTRCPTCNHLCHLNKRCPSIPIEFNKICTNCTHACHADKQCGKTVFSCVCDLCTCKFCNQYNIYCSCSDCLCKLCIINAKTSQFIYIHLLVQILIFAAMGLTCLLSLLTNILPHTDTPLTTIIVCMSVLCLITGFGLFLVIVVGGNVRDLLKLKYYFPCLLKNDDFVGLPVDV